MSGSSNIILGAVICIIGIAVTVGTYNAASETGGTYVVAWGAIVFGAFRLIRGVVQVANGN